MRSQPVLNQNVIPYMKKLRQLTIKKSLDKIGELKFSDVDELKNQIRILLLLYSEDQDMAALFKDMLADLEHHMDEMEDIKNEFREKLAACLGSVSDEDN